MANPTRESEASIDSLSHTSPEYVTESLRSKNLDDARLALAYEFIRSEPSEFKVFVEKVAHGNKQANINKVSNHVEGNATNIYFDDGILWDSKLLSIADNDYHSVHQGLEPESPNHPLADINIETLARRANRILADEHTDPSLAAAGALLFLSEQLPKNQAHQLLERTQEINARIRTVNKFIPQVTFCFQDLDNDGHAEELSAATLAIWFAIGEGVTAKTHQIPFDRGKTKTK